MGSVEPPFAERRSAGVARAPLCERRLNGGAVMKHTRLWPVGARLGLVVLFAPAPAQEPAKPPPTLPPIAPSLARLDETINGLDGRGFAVVASDEAGLLAAACDQGTIQCWS